MKVADAMSKYVDYISVDAKVGDVARLIFGRGVNGVPVCKGKKVVGLITERDILSKFYPTMTEYIEDTIHASDFEGMENKVNEILELPAEKIMTKNPTTISADMPLLRAQSLMFTEKVGRLPVIDKKGILIGIIAQGDIFKSIVGGKVPLDEEDTDFYNWLGEYYDELYNWGKRLDSEIPALAKLFQKEKVRNVLDVSSSTGEHSIALAKKGFGVVGIETSNIMQRLARNKQKGLPLLYRNKIRFLGGSYKKELEELTFNLDAAIFMGNALSSVIASDKRILEDVVCVLNKENPILVFQVLNLEKIFKVQNGFRDFNITEQSYGAGSKYALLSFYTKGQKKNIFISRAVFSLSHDKWVFRGVRSTPVVPIKKQKLVNKLRKLGFTKFSFYGSSLYQPIFKYPFKPSKSDWLNVVAKI
ncbi:MAG: CBS domain-containing protein [Candidatus Levyibacteriota bacterium]